MTPGFPQISMKVFHRGLILVGVPLLIELILIGNLSMLLLRSDKERARENRYRQYSVNAARLMALTYEAPYLALTIVQSNDGKILKAYLRDVRQIRELQERSLKLTDGDPLLEDPANNLSMTLGDYLKLTEVLSTAIRRNSDQGYFGAYEELKKVEKGYSHMTELAIERMTLMARVVQQTLRDSEKRIKNMRRLQQSIINCGLLADLSVGILLLIFYRRGISQRLRVIGRNTVRLSEQQELEAPISGDDEIALLDRTFHAMDRQLKEVAKREKELFDNASDVICVLNSDYRVLKINRACLDNFLYEPDALIGSEIFAILPESERHPFLNAVGESRKSGKAVSFELKVKTGRSSVLETLWSAYWSASEGALFCVAHDISERKNNERVRQQFLSIISTDLRRPLASISNSLGSMLSFDGSSLNDRAREKLKIAEKNTSRLLDLVRDLLQVAEMESGRIELHRVDCNVQELLERAVQEVEAVASKQNVKIEISCGSEHCFADRNRIIQVLVNLLSNAIKFSPESGTVRIVSALFDDSVEIGVIDEGRGVPAHLREAIFEKFKQVQAADGKRKAGTGLGLPICKQIVEEHLGKIGVESEEGSGSRFWFRIPVNEIALPALQRSPDSGGIPERISENAVSPPPPGKMRLPAIISGSGRLKLSQKGLILVGVPIVFELLFVGALSWQLQQSDRYRELEMKQRQIANYASRLIAQYMAMGSLLTSPRSIENWEAFQLNAVEVKKLRRELAYRCRYDKSASYHYGKVEECQRQFDEFYDNCVRGMGNSYSPDKHAELFQYRALLMPVMAGMLRRLQQLMDDAQKREFNPKLLNKMRAQQSALLLLGVSASVLISLALVVYFSKDMSGRLATLADNAERFARDEKLNDELVGVDELVQLDKAFRASVRAVLEARHKERSVFDNSQDFICVLNKDGRFLSVNPAFEKALAYSKSELLSSSLLEICSDDDVERTKTSLLESFSAGGSLVFENKLVRQDGTVCHILWSVSKKSGQEDIYCVARDISSKKELELLKQEFLGMVSHDLRTPLTSILGVVKLLTAGAFGPVDLGVQESAGQIVRESDRLLELINDLLDIEKLEAGKMELVRASVGIQEILLRSADSIVETKRADLSLLLPAADFPVFADADRLVQAISSILNYSLSSAADQGKVKLYVCESENGFEIAVEMQGRSLSEADRAGIFDRFRDVSFRKPAELEFSGLAMPLARRIIELHGGSLSLLAGEDGHSEVFRITLPENRDKTLGQHY